MKVLVTGATGFVGRRLVKQLLANGNEVVALTRNPAKAKQSLPANVSAFAWDPMKEAAPVGAFVGVDAVIHLAGEGVADRRWSVEQKKRIHDSRTVGTQHLVKTLNSLSPKPKTFVSASAIGLYGDRGDERLTEQSSVGSGFLSTVCRDWENEVKKADGAIRTAIIRIGIVLEKGGGALKPMLPLFKLGVGGPVGSGKQVMSWIHLDDLVGLFLFALKTPAISGPMNGTAPSPVTNAQFSKALGKAVHRPAFMPAPAFALRLAMGELADIVLHSQNVFPEKALTAGYSFQFSNVQDALNDICGRKNEPSTIQTVAPASGH